ncbi:MAG: hypothetical protein OXT74_00285 [Candidatus Poribacteria bacterium]|nr:hypothetical protein [Candidatus Poribacteria bacterium]
MFFKESAHAPYRMVDGCGADQCRGVQSGVSVTCLSGFFNRWKYLKTLGEKQWGVVSEEWGGRENGKTRGWEGGESSEE